MTGKIDDTSGAAVVIGVAHNRINTGKAFVASYKTPDATPLSDNAMVEFLVITRNVTTINFAFTATGNGDIEVAFFENTTVSNNGTSVPVIAMNRRRSYPSNATVYRDPTITADGDLLLHQFVSWSNDISANREDTEWHLNDNTNYLVRVINRQGSTQPVSLSVFWYEEDEPR